MTSTMIEKWKDSEGTSDIGTVVWILGEIALQLALLNEHNARMEARYMELTARAAGSKKEKVKRQKAQL